MAIRRINRIALDGSTVAIMFGRHEIPCLKASYGDKLETEVVRFMGSQQIDGRTAGIYSTTDAKISVDTVVYRTQLVPLFQIDGFGNEQLPITVVYGSPDLGYDSDLLDQARIIEPGHTAENSSKANETELTIVFNQLYLTNARLTLNKLDPLTALAASKF